ncbi:DUF5335 family protein [Rhodothermus marinus]|uniref:DUF5335 family protein n=1 Tax=Rhodothermus marinus TaxID=29549 RepID=UPI000A8A09EB|nr:DUF5335 family protein [Rhodothermus marinus]
MAVTKQLPREQWKEYFDNFTKAFLEDLNPEDAVVEIVDPKLGDQFESDYARVIGVSYDPKDNVFEVALEGWIISSITQRDLGGGGGQRVCEYDRSRARGRHERDHPAAERGAAAGAAIIAQ